MAQSDDAPRRVLLTSFFQVKLNELGRKQRVLSVLLFHRCVPKEDRCECADDKWSAILLYGDDLETLSSYDRPPTLVVKGRPVMLPEPDGMLYVLDPTFELYRVEVRASDLERCFDEGTLDEFYKTDDWKNKLQRVLTAHEWSDPLIN